jgi:hypothetical protein
MVGLDYQMRLVSQETHMPESMIGLFLLKAPIDVQGTVKAVAAAREDALNDGEDH